MHGLRARMRGKNLSWFELSEDGEFWGDNECLVSLFEKAIISLLIIQFKNLNAPFANI